MHYAVPLSASIEVYLFASVVDFPTFVDVSHEQVRILVVLGECTKMTDRQFDLYF